MAGHMTTRMSAAHAALTAEFFETHLGSSGLMGIFRNQHPEQTVRGCRMAWDRGVGLVEVPVQSAAALDSLRAAVAAGAERGAVVGAGTVLTVEQVVTVAELGGRFCVSPGIDAEISLACERANLHYLPGVATGARAVAIGGGWAP